MKKFICTCCNIYCKVLQELLAEIVKRKSELRVKDIYRLVD